MLKDYIKYAGFCIVVFLCHIFPARFLSWIALPVALLQYVFDKGGREKVKKNLRQILPDATEERITYEARWVFRNFGKYLTEFFRLSSFDKRYCEKHVALKGTENVDKALAEGHGCILLTAHLSNWELGAAAFRVLYDKPVTVIVAMHRYGRINEMFIRERESMGLKVVDMLKAPREIMRALKNNEVVGIVGDRDPTEQGTEVDFFGKPCRFPQGPARFALATGAPIVPAFCLRRTNDSFTVYLGDPIPVPQSGDREERVAEMIQSYAKVIEEAVRWHPEEWNVFYDVWGEGWRGQ
ncbi:MAG: lysophospholipid acyltransferase family protein [Planctomycetes bacterium]|nr:lysophospholipid acyltransferase family protein [Planctomycetota bacterium]